MYLIVAVSITLILIACSAELNPPAPQITTYVELVGVDTTLQDQGCNYRYYLEFKDEEDPDPNVIDSSRYWVGIARRNIYHETVLFANSIDTVLEVPFANPCTLQVDLSHDMGASTNDSLFPILVGGSGAGDLNNDNFTKWGDYIDSFNGFPEHCCPFDIEMYSFKAPLGKNEYCALVTHDGEMPSLTLEAISMEDLGLVTCTLFINYNRSRRNDADTFLYTMNGNCSWDIKSTMLDKVRGGEAVIKCYSDNLGCYQYYNFGIRGVNAPEIVVSNYIENADNDKWYPKYIAKHESWIPETDYNPLRRYYLQFNDGAFNCDSSDVNGTPNWGDDGEGRPGGFGLFQLTNFFNGSDWGVPNKQELWDWKENVNSGVFYINYLYNDSYNYMTVQRSNAANVSFELRHVPDTTLFDVLFSDNTDNIIENAVAIKRYNGRGGGGNGEFIEFNLTNQSWVFHPLNNYDQPFNYVARICSTYTASQ